MNHLKCAYFEIRLVSLWLLIATSQSLIAENLAELSRFGHNRQLRSLVNAGANLEEKDAGGYTALHWAALNEDAKLVRYLLDQGAEVDVANNMQATPLMYASGSIESVQALIEKGANVNHVSRLKGTPLMAAVLRPGTSEIVKRLLEKGANPDVTLAAKGDISGANLVDLAGYNGDLETVRLLLAAGAKPTDVTIPAWKGHQEIVETLLRHGAGAEGSDVFWDHSLNISLYGQNPEIARLLIHNGVDLNFRSPLGQHEVPPMLWAAYNESQDASVAELLISKGVDPNTEGALGETALDWARARGNTKLEAVLLAAGGRTGSKPLKKKTIPNRSLPDHDGAFDRVIEDSINRAIRLLQKNSDGFLNSGIVREQQCISCHQQSLPAVAYGWAWDRGLQVDQESIARQVQDQIRYWTQDEQIGKAHEMIPPQPDASTVIGYGLEGLSALNYPAGDLTESMLRYLAAMQMPDGSWASTDYRPPMEDGPIVGTAFALRSLQLYPIPGLKRGVKRHLRKGRRYLRHAAPVNLNQQAFQLLGLGWAGEPSARLKQFVDEIVNQQQPDGGWAQLAGLNSDAWATGLVLVALNTAGGMATTNDVYQRGIRFLLRTQFEDGSWYVKSRTWPFQPHFESGFPHGKDQWISAGGSTWATMALLATQPLVAARTMPDWMTMNVTRDLHSRTKPFQNDRPAMTTSPTLDYHRDIKPILERSCHSCHGDVAEKNKGGFDMTAKESFLTGGQSADPVVLIGKADASPLIHMVTDAWEDFEMPPLSKRDQYPKLSPNEISLLKTWIDQGLPWKN